jgi:Ca2+-binding RTX toxin-like protein
LYGGSGNDFLDASNGFNTLNGGSGRDVFFLSTISYGHIEDFQDGVDFIQGLNFNSVDIYQFDSNNTIITDTTRSVAYAMLANVNANTITAADFI